MVGEGKIIPSFCDNFIIYIYQTHGYTEANVRTYIVFLFILHKSWWINMEVNKYAERQMGTCKVDRIILISK